MVLDNSNDVIVTGSAVTLEYNTIGNLAWNAPYNAASVGVDASNNVYITGVSSNFETIKLNPVGSNVWSAVETAPYSGPTVGLAIAVDAAGESFVAGDEPFVPQNLSYQECLTVVKYSGGGGLIWRDTLDSGELSLVGESIGVSALVLNGQTNLYLELGETIPMNQPFTTLCFADSGSVLWSQGNPTGNGASLANGISLDGFGNVLITGKDGHGYPNNSYCGTYKLNHCHPVLASAAGCKWLNVNAMRIKDDVSDSEFVLAFAPAPAMPDWLHARWKIDFFATDQLDSPGAISPLCQSLPWKLQDL